MLPEQVGKPDEQVHGRLWQETSLLLEKTFAIGRNQNNTKFDRCSPSNLQINVVQRR